MALFGIVTEWRIGRTLKIIRAAEATHAADVRHALGIAVESAIVGRRVIERAPGAGLCFQPCLDQHRSEQSATQDHETHTYLLFFPGLAAELAAFRSFTLATNARTSGKICGSRAFTSCRVMPG